MSKTLRTWLSRRSVVASLVVFVSLFGVLAVSLMDSGARVLAASADSPEVVVFKTPTCGCCSLWVAHLRANGFKVRTTDLEDLSGIRREWRVPSKLQSCHTARIGRYVIEGHVPAADIRRLLETTPRVDGLTVPGMPIGSPGMEQGNQVEPYDVLTFNAAGETSVFSSHR